MLRLMVRVICPLTFSVACASGKRWVAEPEIDLEERPARTWQEESGAKASSDGTGSRSIRRIGRAPERLSDAELADAPGERPRLVLGEESDPLSDAPPDAKPLGVFRNTYYDFPSELDFTGPQVNLMGPSCQPLFSVPRPFFESLCVQGSGTLKSGATVSFASRDCSCAEVCPRTGQKICFDALDPMKFPWGRGALGKAITPLRSVAVDSTVIPLGTKLYIAEFDGVPRSPGGAPHDGCFVAEDRGLKVQGEHIDIFTGNPRATAHFNGIVPSNRGVHVYTSTARCEASP